MFAARLLRSRWLWLMASMVLCTLSFQYLGSSDTISGRVRQLTPWVRDSKLLQEQREQREQEVNADAVLQRLVKGADGDTAVQPFTKTGGNTMRSTLTFDKGDSTAAASSSAILSVEGAQTIQTAKLREDNTGEIVPVSLPKTVTNVVLIKTHKTASTTLASILFRLGMNHNLRMFVPHYHYIDLKRRPMTQPKSNISMYHHFTPSLQTEPLINWYKEWLPEARFITILREPYQRVLSEYYYFFQPDAPQIPLYDLLTNKTHDILKKLHIMSHDLGVYTNDDLELFLKQNYKLFDQFLITELFDESLILMKRRYNWDLEDLLYLKLLDACRDGKRSWDKKKVNCAKTDRIDDLSSAILKDYIKHDNAIYSFVRDLVQKQIDAQPPDYWTELDQFRAKQKELTDVCGVTDLVTWLANPGDLTREQRRMCFIFRMNDLQFEHITKLSGGMVNQIMVDYEIRLIERQNIPRRTSNFFKQS